MGDVQPSNDNGPAGRYAPFREYRTWFRTFGDFASPLVPVIVVHGGPGLTHDYLLPFKELAEDGRPVVFYDQIGNGRSTRLPGQPDGFWTVDLFAEELDNLIAVLGLDRYALLGQSFGGSIAMSHAARRPAGLMALVLANSFASAPQFLEGAFALRGALPADVRETLDRLEAAGQFADPDYQAAMAPFYSRHVCRLEPWPDALMASMGALAADPTVFAAVYGPSLFRLTGTLRTWSLTDRLAQISVPTLAYRGAYDEVAAACTETILAGIGGAVGHTFAHSSHTPHLEETDLCLRVVRDFLNGADGPAA